MRSSDRWRLARTGDLTHPYRHNKLDEAARIAKAAEACAQSGAIAEGVEVAMDIEQLIYEAGRLQDAALLLDRISRSKT